MDVAPKKTKFKAWVQASRPHTLPLALAGIGMGNFIALRYQTFDGLVAALTFLTAICLQVLSNIANDYGDTRHGADNASRVGPKRMAASGELSAREMKAGILISIILSFVSGIALLMLGTRHIGYTAAIVLFAFGLLAIAAAVAYTASKKPYGYRGLGDLSVFLFFGLLAVCGSYYLQSGTFSVPVLLPAIGMGCLCAGVLNINNMRDIEADALANKMTIPLKIGLKNALIYHWVLMLVPVALFTEFMLYAMHSGWQLLGMAPALLFIRNAYRVSKSNTPEQIAPCLKQLVISVLIFTIAYGLALVLF